MRQPELTIVSTILGALLYLIPEISIAGNEFNMRICGKWTSQYDDSGQGEDKYSSTAQVNRQAAYAAYKVKVGSSTIISGHLGGSGCTPYFTAEDGVKYKIYQGTRYIRDTYRTIYVQPVQSGANPPVYNNWYLNYVKYYTPSGHSQGEYYTHVNTVNASFQSNIGPIVGRLLGIANALNIPNNTVFHILGYPGGSAYAGDQNVMIYYLSGGGDGSAVKFIVAHEIGHAIGDLNNCSLASYMSYAENATSQYCKCTGHTHCLQSWEYIHDGQDEGWAHFISTVIYNNRDDGDGFFGYYKATTFPPSYGVPGNQKDPPWSLDTNDPYQWMEEECSGEGMTNHGTEWDWLTFFWDVWANGDDRIAISDLHDIWPSKSDPLAAHNWEKENDTDPDGIVERADNELSLDEFENFVQVADDNGVDH